MAPLRERKKKEEARGGKRKTVATSFLNHPSLLFADRAPVAGSKNKGKSWENNVFVDPIYHVLRGRPGPLDFDTIYE